jgi:hypothetical protein
MVNTFVSMLDVDLCPSLLMVVGELAGVAANTLDGAPIGYQPFLRAFVARSSIRTSSCGLPSSHRNAFESALHWNGTSQHRGSFSVFIPGFACPPLLHFASLESVIHGHPKLVSILDSQAGGIAFLCAFLEKYCPCSACNPPLARVSLTPSHPHPSSP